MKPDTRTDLKIFVLAMTFIFGPLFGIAIWWTAAADDPNMLAALIISLFVVLPAIFGAITLATWLVTRKDNHHG